jgi:hypothetical protein
MLSHGKPFEDEDAELTARKEDRMVARARTESEETTPESLESVGEELIEKAPLLERLAREAGNAG